MKIKQYLQTALLLGFLLGIHNGYIALWKDGDAQPVQVYPYKAAHLPVSDQMALEKGIVTESETELAQLLEDYLS